MQVNAAFRWQLRLSQAVFVVLLLAAVGLLAWLSARYELRADWTATGRNTLSTASVELLARMPGPVTVTAYARESGVLQTRQRIRELIRRYQRHKPDLTLSFVNPDTAPEQTRALGISVDGELVVRYGERTEHVQRLSEETLSNALQRLLRSGERQVVFVTGHGERSPQGQANHDLSAFTQALQAKGVRSATVNLALDKAIPEDTAALVIASPQVAYLPGEVTLIRDYLAAGGNLLWLHDPEAGPLGLEALAEYLGIDFQPGVIVDPTTQLLGLDDPTITLVAAYGRHAITRDFQLLSVLPRAAGIVLNDGDWEGVPLALSADNSWSETGPLQGTVRFDEGQDVHGPLNLAVALTRPRPGAQDEAVQRVVVAGDGDFLSNAYLGNQGNQDLGHKIVNWLSHDDVFIEVPARAAPDRQLNLDERTWSLLGLFFLLGLPALLLGAGLTTWYRRRRR